MRRLPRSSWIGWLTFGVALGCALTAAAQTPAPPQGVAWSASTTAKPPAARYPIHTLMVDFAGLALGVAVAQAREGQPSRLGVIAGTWYGVGVVAAPAVHEAHGNWPVGLADLGLRALVPPLVGTLGLLGACLSKSDFDRKCVRDGWATGSLVGLAGAAAIDALFLADERHRPITYSGDGWYGHHILIVDAIGYGLGLYFAIGAPKTKSGSRIHPATAVWALGYPIGFIGAPIVHFSHGEVARGFGSLGIRLLVGPMGAVVGLMGYCAASGGARDCAAHGAQWGLLGGSLAASLFDAFVLAQDSDPEKHSHAPHASVGLGSLSVRAQF
jgi:hypothetical protein